jgi:hypothetical protein
VVNLLPEKVETEEKSEGNRDVVVLTEIHHCTGYKPAITQGTPPSRAKCYPSTLRYTYKSCSRVTEQVLALGDKAAATGKRVNPRKMRRQGR